MTHRIDDDLAALGSPEEAAPLTSASVLLAQAGVLAPVVVGWVGWKLYTSWVAMLGAGVLLGTVLSTTGMLLLQSGSGEVTAPGPHRVEIVHRYERPGTGAERDASGALVRVTALPAPVSPMSARRASTPVLGPDVVPDLVTKVAPASEGLVEPGNGVLPPLDDDPTPLDDLIGFVDAPSEDADPSAREHEDRSNPLEWRGHVVIGARRGVGIIEQSRGLGVSAGAEFYPRSAGAFGTVFSARTDLAMVGLVQRTELVAGLLEAGLAMRGHRASARLSVGTGAQWHAEPLLNPGSADSEVGAGTALTPAMLTGLHGIVGPRAAIVVGDRDRAAVQLTGGADAMPLRGVTPVRLWVGVGLDVPLATGPKR